MHTYIYKPRVRGENGKDRIWQEWTDCCSWVTTALTTFYLTMETGPVSEKELICKIHFETMENKLKYYALECPFVSIK